MLIYARWSGSKKAVSRYNVTTYSNMGSEGFEPTKAEPTDLQSAPFDHSGNSPVIQVIYRKNKVLARGYLLFLNAFGGPNFNNSQPFAYGGIYINF